MSDVSFAGQLTANQLTEIKEKGFVSVINNRPDNEEPGQPNQADIESQAKQLGLEYAYIPVVGGQMTQQDVEDFAKAYSAMAKPVLMFCRTGNRSSVLYQAAIQMNLISE